MLKESPLHLLTKCTDKNIYTNYRLFSVLNTFSEIIESSIFDQLTKWSHNPQVTQLTKYAKEVLQIFEGVNRKLYRNQNILIRLIEE